MRNTIEKSRGLNLGGGHFHVADLSNVVHLLFLDFLGTLEPHLAPVSL